MEIKGLAEIQGWLEQDAKLPDDQALASFFDLKGASGEQKSKAEPYIDLIKKWVESGIQASTIHQYLINTYGFTGAYGVVD